MKCPKCGSEAFERDEVDVGPCSVPAGPYGCLDCGYVEPDFPEEGDDGSRAAEDRDRWDHDQDRAREDEARQDAADAAQAEAEAESVRDQEFGEEEG